jgi:hypothetical protein
VTLSLKSRLRDTIEELRRSLQPKEGALEALQQSLLEKDQVCISLKRTKFDFQNFAFPGYRTPCIVMCVYACGRIYHTYMSLFMVVCMYTLVTILVLSR